MDWHVTRCTSMLFFPRRVGSAFCHLPLSRLVQPGEKHAICMFRRYQSVNIETLPSEDERTRSDLAKDVSKRMDKIHEALFTAGQRLNDLTGYSGIERLKQSIEEQGPCP